MFFGRAVGLGSCFRVAPEASGTCLGVPLGLFWGILGPPTQNPSGDPFSLELPHTHSLAQVLLKCSVSARGRTALLGPSIWAFLQDRAPPICWPSLLSFLQEPMSGDELMAPSSPGGSSSRPSLLSPVAIGEEMELSLDEAHSVPADLVMSGTSSASCELSSGSAAVSAESPIISDGDAQAGLVGARGWQPGTNCGGFNESFLGRSRCASNPKSSSPTSTQT